MSETMTPTAERIRHAGSAYLPPETSQREKRDYGRIRPWYETAALKNVITAEQAMAARDVDLYWHAVNDAVGVIGSYGSQRWNGTPVSQLSLPAMMGPEWRETARARLRQAQHAIDNQRAWQLLCRAIETNGSLQEIGAACGIVGSERTVRFHTSRHMREALDRLAIFWQFKTVYHDPGIKMPR